MRTTIELTDSLHTRLVQLAAERGQKGFSGLVQEALEAWLTEQSTGRARVKAALAALGSFDDEAAGRLRRAARKARSRWR